MLHLGRHSADPELWTAAIERSRHLSTGCVRPGAAGCRASSTSAAASRRRGTRSDAGCRSARIAPPRAPGVEEYAEAICAPLAARLDRLGIAAERIQLEIEPGRALYADAGIHLATVGNVKRQTEPTPLTWVETDSSDAYLADVNLEFNRWTCLAAGDADAPAAIVADVTGRTCALDVIVSDAELPSVAAGDVLAFLDTGAYQDASASNFNALPRPGTALVSGGSAELIRRHETIDDVFARDLIPDRLRAGASDDGDRWHAIGLDHVSVTSGDLERSLAFYCDLLGLTLRARGDGLRRDELEITGVADASARWADLELPHGQVLELIEYLAPRGTPSTPAPMIRGRPTSRFGWATSTRSTRAFVTRTCPCAASRSISGPGALAGRAMLLRERSRRGDRGADPGLALSTARAASAREDSRAS